MKNIRNWLAILFAALFVAIAPSNAADRNKAIPIVFVHGNGDTAALWHTTIWRFESNGYPRQRLFAIDFKNPLARSNDAVAQANRSSTAEQMEELAAFVADVKKRTGAAKVALVGSSRGGNSIRNFVKNGGGAAHVSHVVLCGAVNHGVVALDDYLVGSEFNGKSPFLVQLNSGPSEVVEGVKFMTIRSENNDKFAQPDGRFVGIAGKPTNITYEGPALNGALNVSLPTLDHREVAFHPRAFREIHVFITGEEPKRLEIRPEPRPVLNGKITGMAGTAPTNIPVAGAKLEVFRVSPETGERQGRAVHTKTTDSSGEWGPFRADPKAYYEFVVAAPGASVTHYYRSPFPRSSNYIHMRPLSIDEKDKSAAAVVSFTRPRGYFGIGRDTLSLDGKLPSGINEGVPGVSSGRLLYERVEQRPVVAIFNGEKIAARMWPAQENHHSVAEFHY